VTIFTLTSQNASQSSSQYSVRVCCKRHPSKWKWGNKIYTTFV